MKEFKLPSGRIVRVGRFDDNNIIVEFKDEVEHKLVFSNKLSPEEVDKHIHDYLYGYTDNETGEHVPGYFELVKSKKEGEKAWWQ